MYIFIDTNVFYNNWQLKNADFKFLFNYLENSHSILLMSDLVCEEVENIRQRELQGSINSLKNELKKITKYNSVLDVYDFDKLNEEYDFKSKLKIRTENIEFIPYNRIEQSVVVKRALKNIKPFQEEEKGYRDTLIWLSFMEYLKNNNSKKEIAFITNNKSDFYANGKLEFHSDLKKDIEEFGITCKIIPYDSLYKFIDKQVDKGINEYKIAELQETYLDTIDDIIEEESEDFINQLSSYDLLEILKTNELKEFSYLNTLLGHDFEITEGVEDPEILTCKKIDNNLIYISYRYNLRRCVLSFTISNSDYYSKQQEIDKGYYEVTTLKNETSFCSYVRTYLDVSFNYNILTKSIEGFNIENIYFK